jgi:lipopolysaccharide/colanic/teichoic acid biosynthesis glycosyltransferase
MTTPEANMGYRLKRVFDLCIAVPAFVVAAPIMLLTAMLVAIFLGRPVLFRHQRPGRNAKPFTILKFHTMTQEVVEDGELLPDSENLTLFGRFLRSTSFDKLPELIGFLLRWHRQGFKGGDKSDSSTAPIPGAQTLN